MKFPECKFPTKFDTSPPTLDRHSEVPSAGAPWRQSLPETLLPFAPPVAGQLVPSLGHDALASSLSADVPFRCRLLAAVGFTTAIGAAAAGVHRDAGSFTLSGGQAVVRPLITRARAVALVLALGASKSPEKEEEEDSEDDEEECADRSPSPRGGGAGIGVESTGRVARPGSTGEPCVFPFPPAPAAAAAATLLLVLRLGAAAGALFRAAAVSQLSNDSSLAGSTEDTEPLFPPALLTAAAVAPPTDGVSTTPAGETPASVLAVPVLIGDLPSGAAEFVSSLMRENALEKLYERILYVSRSSGNFRATHVREFAIGHDRGVGRKA